jgi:hypothetical protein
VTPGPPQIPLSLPENHPARPAHAPQARGRAPGRTRHHAPDRPRSGGQEEPAGREQGQGAPVVLDGFCLPYRSPEWILAVLVRVGVGRRDGHGQPPEAVGLGEVALGLSVSGRAE